MRRLVAVLSVLLTVVGCSKKESVATRDDHVCEPVRIASAYLAMMEKPDAARTLLIGDGAKALEPFLTNAGTKCLTTLDGKFDLIVTDCRRMSRASCAALRGRLAPKGVVAWLMDVRGVSLRELHGRMSDFELYDVHLWMPGRDRWLLVGCNAHRRLKLASMLELFTRERTFGDLARAKCGTLPELFASYAGTAHDFAPAFAQAADADVEVRPEHFLTKDVPAIGWISPEDVDADIANAILADMRSMQLVRRLAVEGAMLSESSTGNAATTNAVEMLARAARRNPNDLFIVERLDRLDRNARGFLNMGQILMAMKCYETMVLIQPGDAAAVHNFGMCLKKIGKTKLADEILKRAEALVGNRPAVPKPKPPSLPSGSRYKTSNR